MNEIKEDYDHLTPDMIKLLITELKSENIKIWNILLEMSKNIRAMKYVTDHYMSRIPISDKKVFPVDGDDDPFIRYVPKRSAVDHMQIDILNAFSNNELNLVLPPEDPKELIEAKLRMREYCENYKKLSKPKP